MKIPVKTIRRKKMENSLGKHLVLIVAMAIITSFSACGGQPVAAKYQGNWSGADGSTLYMSSDGKAGFVVGNKKVDGGGAVVDESAKTITISLFGISNTWKIDEEPNEKGEMKLDGKIFRRK
jgi:hypothetical protein